MNLSQLSNSDLISKTKFVSSEERRLTTELLHYISEVDKRRLYCELGYSSLHEFMMKELHYSETAAQRRICAMRLIKDMPLVESKIKEGSLSLTTAAQAQVFFRQEKKLKHKNYTTIEKQNFLQTIEGKSSREVEKVIKSIAPELVLPKEKEKAVTNTKTLIQFIADESLMEKFKLIRQNLGRSVFHLSYEELFTKMADNVLAKIEKEEKRLETKIEEKPAPEPTKSRYIPVKIKYDIVKRDQGQCCFTSPITGKRCEAKTGLQFDHRLPLFLGGETLLENIQILCKSHNQYQAIEKIGKEVMGNYIDL